MKVHQGLGSVRDLKNPAITIGTFDGVHLGHQKIITQLKAAARSINGESLILTFYPHPRMILFPDDHGIKLLSTEEEKKNLLEKMEVDHLVVHPFTKEFSRLTYMEYVRDILVSNLHVRKLIIGYNHHFGRNREGTYEKLEALAPIYNFQLEQIPAQLLNNVEISSTKIRKALDTGNIPTANKYLGYEYSICGEVIHGKGLGKQIGYPTANIKIDSVNKLIPADGIYTVTAEVQKKRVNGMMSIGFNPTVNGKNRTIEINLFDFDTAIYGETIRIYFKQKIRDEIKFNSLEDLMKQLSDDKKKSLEILTP